MLPVVLFTMLGWMLLALASGAALWFITGGRVRLGAVRPRRCPKCWYDLSHTPGMTCSECGYAAQRESQLHRARRRWPVVVLIALLFMCSWFSFRAPAVRARGWIAAVPTTAFILFFERVDLPAAQSTIQMLWPPSTSPAASGWSAAAGEELVLARFAQPMWRWQRWLFLYRASRLVDPLGAAQSRGGAMAFAEPATVPELFLAGETKVWGEPTQPSSHARRVWDRIIGDVVVTPTSAAAGREVIIEVKDSLWHRGEHWRALLVRVEGESEPCLARLVAPYGVSEQRVTTAKVRVPADGMLRLYIQLTEPDPPRTRVGLAGHYVLWEAHLERRVEIKP